jgi:hypothetical protein
VLTILERFLEFVSVSTLKLCCTGTSCCTIAWSVRFPIVLITLIDGTVIVFSSITDFDYWIDYNVVIHK